MTTDTPRPTPDPGTQAPWSGQTGWHLAAWGTLGWTETVLKGFGIAVALVAALGGGGVAIAEGHAVAHWLLIATAVGYVAAVTDRLQDREITAMVFVAAMIVGHGAMAWAAGADGGNPDAWPRGAVVLFALAMAAGDAVKIAYFLTTGARVRDLPRWLPIVMTATLLAVYLVIAALALT